MAKVVDNWTKFGCASSPSKDFSSGNSNCGKCCGDEEEATPFKDEIKSDGPCSLCF